MEITNHKTQITNKPNNDRNSKFQTFTSSEKKKIPNMFGSLNIGICMAIWICDFAWDLGF